MRVADMTRTIYDLYRWIQVGCRSSTFCSPFFFALCLSDTAMLASLRQARHAFGTRLSFLPSLVIHLISSCIRMQVSLITAALISSACCIYCFLPSILVA